MIPIRTVAPADLLTLAEIKAHCLVDHTDDDTKLTALGRDAVDRLDGYAGVLGRCLVQQTWAQSFQTWGNLRLWCGSVQSVVVTYRDLSDTVQTVDAASYELIHDPLGAYVRLKPSFTAPTLNTDRLEPVTVTFVAGYGLPSDVPARIKTLALMIVAYTYANPGGDPVEENREIKALIHQASLTGV